MILTIGKESIKNIGKKEFDTCLNTAGEKQAIMQQIQFLKRH